MAKPQVLSANSLQRLENSKEAVGKKVRDALVLLNQLNEINAGLQLTLDANFSFSRFLHSLSEHLYCHRTEAEIRKAADNDLIVRWMKAKLQ